MNKATNRKELPRASTEEVDEFRELLKFARETTNCLKIRFPWLYAELPEVRVVAVRASFPRSIAGSRQDDSLLRLIYFTKQRYPDATARLKITETVIEYLDGEFKQAGRTVSKEDEETFARVPGGNDILEFRDRAAELYRVVNLGERFQPKTDAEFFKRIAGDLEYLDDHKPTAGDYAVEALQNAFIGKMQSKYEWGKKGLPTKGEVEQMAKAQLARVGRENKSGWTDLRRTGGLAFLPEGRAGRPTKREVDENAKAKQEFLSKQTQYVNEVLGGDWSLLNDKAGYVFGGKPLTQQAESDRLKQYGHQELLSDKEELE